MCTKNFIEDSFPEGTLMEISGCNVKTKPPKTFDLKSIKIATELTSALTKSQMSLINELESELSHTS